MKFKNIICKIKDFIRHNMLLLWLYFMLPQKYVLCEDWFDSEIYIPDYGDDIKTASNTFAGDILTLFAGVLSVIGLIIIAYGIFTYFKAKYEESAAGESKGMHIIAVGIALIAAPQMFQALVS